MLRGHRKERERKKNTGHLPRTHTVIVLIEKDKESALLLREIKFFV